MTLTARGERFVNKRAFGQEIILPGAMIIQMIARQVGKHGAFKIDELNPSLVEPVRRNFHHAVFDVLFPRAWRETAGSPRGPGGIFRGQDLFPDPAIDGAHDAAGLACFVQNGFDEIGDRRLAVGAGYADRFDFGGQRAVKPARDLMQEFMRIIDVQKRTSARFFAGGWLEATTRAPFWMASSINCAPSCLVPLSATNRLSFSTVRESEPIPLMASCRGKIPPTGSLSARAGADRSRYLLIIL